MLERWNSPFAWSIPYNLFIKHFTELNSIYWAQVPAANTIEKKAIEFLKSDYEDPTKYFLIPDEDDRRIAKTYKEWKQNYREFSNYMRLSMLMLLSSCLETYLRTIVSLAIESKPGCIIGCADAIDGVFLLKTKDGYGEIDNHKYQFGEVIESICKGDWYSRIFNYEKYFGKNPLSDKDIKELDEIRQKRNLVGHYFGRIKQKYEAPLSLIQSPAERLSHKKLMDYFNVVCSSIKQIDKHLHNDFIGSYDICKYYYLGIQNGTIQGNTVGIQAKCLQKLMGSAGMPSAGTAYYYNLVSYMATESKDDEYRYVRKTCIIMINRKLREKDRMIIRNGKRIPFTSYHFNLFCNVYCIHNDTKYCKKNHTQYQMKYFYSEKLIDFISSKICENPEIVEELLKQVKKTKSQPSD